MNPAPPSSSGELPPGARFHGRYRVVRELGAGGMGSVYEVVDEQSGAPLALKVMHASLARRSALRARFEQEARVTSGIASEHLVRVHDAGVADETPFIVMELLRGRGVDALLRERGRMDPSEACALLSDVGRALDQTHRAGIVHRDLKPENLFLTARADGSQCVKILDFGVAKIFKDASAPLTRTVGTPLFMAPEQVRGDGDVGPQADVYGLVQVAYDLLVGEPYWSEESRPDAPVLSLMVRVLEGPAEPASRRALRRAGVALPAAFDAWFHRGTSGTPAQRFTSATQAIAELAALFPRTAPIAAAAARTAPSAFDASGPTMAPDDAFTSALATGPTRFDNLGARDTVNATAPQAATLTNVGSPQMSVGATQVSAGATQLNAAATHAGATRLGEGPTLVGQNVMPLRPQHAVPPRRRSPRWPWVLGAAVALGGGAVAIALLSRSGSDASTRSDTRTKASVEPTASAGPEPSASLDAYGTVPKGPGCLFSRCIRLDFPDVSAVPPAALLARARALAMAIDKDAVFIQMTASGIWTNGAFDMRGYPSLNYSFRGSAEDITILPYQGQLGATLTPLTLYGPPPPELGCTFDELFAIATGAKLATSGRSISLSGVPADTGSVYMWDGAQRSIMVAPRTCKILASN